MSYRGTCGALGMPTLPGNGWSDLVSNRIFVTGFMAWLTAQILKVGVTAVGWNEVMASDFLGVCEDRGVQTSVLLDVWWDALFTFCTLHGNH